MHKLANKYDLYPHAKFNTTVKSIQWNDCTNVWKVITKNEKLGEIETEYDFV